jgi:hypothetical protein
MTKDSWIGFGIPFGVAGYFLAAALLELDPAALLGRIVGAVPILVLLILLPFWVLALLASLFRCCR